MTTRPQSSKNRQYKDQDSLRSKQVFIIEHQVDTTIKVTTILRQEKHAKDIFQPYS